jgi:group I intron endonuclease
LNLHKQLAKKKINRYLYDSMNHHGFDNFCIILIEECEDDVANARERFWIEQLQCQHPNGYNMTLGGDGGFTLAKYSLEERREIYRKQGEARKGRPRSNETRAKISAAHAGKTVSQEAREKLSKTLKERGVSPPEYTKWKKGQVGTQTGSVHRDESKEAMSKWRKGKTYDEICQDKETADRLREMHRERFTSNNPNAVVITDADVKYFLSLLISDPYIKLSECSQMTKLSPFKLRQILRDMGIYNLQKFRNEHTHDYIGSHIGSYLSESTCN